MKISQKKIYDCDTSDYHCSDIDYHNSKKTFGEFIDNGCGYQITDPNTPRPWLNYLANHKFGSVVSNKGLGFSWFRSTLLRVTKYEHPVDYLPREFKDGREIIITDDFSGKKINLFREGENLICEHYPGFTKFLVTALDLKFEICVFVSLEDSCEILTAKILNKSNKQKNIKIVFQQTWAFALFGIHTAEEGIPYISTPGKDLEISEDDFGIFCHSTNEELPYEMFGIFQSTKKVDYIRHFLSIENRTGKKEFKFHQCELEFDLSVQTGGEEKIEIISGAEINRKDFEKLKNKYRKSGVVNNEFLKLKNEWDKKINTINCSTPDADFNNFLNVWFKNQLNLVFYFVRSGQNGYRDSLQDAWGVTLYDWRAAEKRFYEILSYQCADGTAPRNFSAFGNDLHDMRRFMDSPVWIPRTLIDLIKQTGDFSILDKKIPFIDGEAASVDEHVFRALDYLYKNRGAHKICLTGDGDWNDALEGISRDGDAESVWLTIALFDAMNLMSELYEQAGKIGRAEILRKRAEEIKKIVNDVAWDGEWYVYGFTGSGKPIGSSKNKEGKIHLNAQTWAVFSGLADEGRAKKAMASVDKFLGTPLGPALLAPPYAEEADEVGRIANLEPGTFENGSVYQHAVTFYIYACAAMGYYEKAYETFVNMLPTNPKNFDTRRTSEPYCTGNYYCGPEHPRFGQNFFSWFTGNCSWLLRAGFDEILGIKSEFNGLRISPRIPFEWEEFSVKKIFRNCCYKIVFDMKGDYNIKVNGKEINGNLIPGQLSDECNIEIGKFILKNKNPDF